MTKTTRTPSPETLRKRTSNAYIDAMAETKKAFIAVGAAHARYEEAASAELAARKECIEAGLPVANMPPTLRVTEEAPKP